MRSRVGMLRLRVACVAVFAFLLLSTVAGAQPVSIPAVNTAVTQDFNTLANTGTSSAVPPGWAFTETGSNANVTYNSGTGSSATGDTYSFGATGSTDRAFGGLQSGSLVPNIGAAFVNNTGVTITSLVVSYVGEQWRLGATPRAVADRLDFQYSESATGLLNGVFTNVDGLDFAAPVTAGTVGALDGNASANRSTISYTVTALNIPNGATFWIKWSSSDVSGADDGLAIDDFSITANPSGTPTPTNPTASGSAAPSAVYAGETSVLTVTVTPGANPTSTGISVVADLTAIGGSASQAFAQVGTTNVFTYTATVASGTTAGLKTLPVSVADAQLRSATSTIALTVNTPAPVLAINQIQGSGLTSAYVGQTVSTFGVVTALKYKNGFFIQTPDTEIDADPQTSEGLFVFVNGVPSVTVGSYLRVTGRVTEYRPDANGLTITELSSPSIVVLSNGAPLPAPYVLTSADLPPGSTMGQLEWLEGMHVAVPSLRVVAPTNDRFSPSAEVDATSLTGGVFFGVIGDTPRPFREAGIENYLPVPTPPAGSNPLRFDANLERLRVSSWGQIGIDAMEVTAGTTLSNMVGVLDFDDLTWTILPDTTPLSSGNVSATPVAEPEADEFTVAAYNLERFFDTIDDPALDDDPVLTPLAFGNRLNKASLGIRDVMRTPDILGVVEVENLPALEALAAKINADAVAAGEPNPNYVAYLEEGNDVGGIDVGFLVKSSRVSVTAVTQEGEDATFTDPSDGSIDILNDRPPLLLEATVHGPSGDLPVTVIVNHLRSLGSIETARVRAKRLAQAEFLANLVKDRQIANPGERIVLVGDFNAFEVNDGWVDVIGSIIGQPAPATDVYLTGADILNPDLIDLPELVPAGERYSYVFNGNAQVLDHAIVNPRAFQRFTRMQFARMNADFPETYRNDANRPERLSDHDGLVAYFAFPGAPVLQLNGDNPMTVECCTTFSDPGATASDEDLGDLTSSIVVEGTVDAMTVGAYTLTYTVSNGYATTTVTRTVNVVDTLPPTITLNGANPMTVELGSTFSDPGATATDTCAGDLTSSIVVSGGVNTSAVGTYLVTYAVTDGHNAATVIRTVSVVDTTAPVLSFISPDPATLWPANHTMRLVNLHYTVADASGATTCSVGVTSNEPDNGTGDGDTPVDWLAVGPTAVRLRAERAGWGDGRFYTVAVTCMDASGNSATGFTLVTVPKSSKVK